MSIAPSSLDVMAITQSLNQMMAELGMAEGAEGEMPPMPEDFGNQSDLESQLVIYLTYKTRLGRGLANDEKERWGRYELMRRNEWRLDDPEDFLSRAGMYLPITARKIDVAKSSILSEIFPDRTNLNFFDARSKIEHLDGNAEKARQAVRGAFVEMKPSDAQNYAQLTSMAIDNLFTFGNAYQLATIGTITTEAKKFLGKPILQWIDPFNVVHFDLDVNHVSQTDSSILITRDERQLDESGYDPELIEYIRETYPPTIRSRRNTAESGAYYDYWYLSQSIDRKLYNFWMYCGHWPGREIPGLDDDEAAWESLGEKFGFTVEEARAAQWWHMEWIGWTLCVCQPWPVMQETGQCPLIHARLFQVPGRLLGQGAYHRTEWHERMYNKLLRGMVQYTQLCAKPGGFYDETAISTAYLQKVQSKGAPLCGPNIWVPVNRAMGTQQGGKPIEPFLFNVDALQYMSGAMDYHENKIAEIIGITDAVEGDANSKTATQDANNLQQSLKTLFDYIGTIECELLLPGVKGVYLALQQCYQLSQVDDPGFYQMVAGDPGDMAYRSLVVTPEDLITLALIEFTITGSSSPGNKANQIQQAFTWVDKFAAFPGLINLPVVARGTGEMMGIGPIDSWINNQTPEMLLRKLENIASMFGPAGMQTYYAMTSDPQIMQGLGLMQMAQQGAMVPGMPMQGGMGGGMGGTPTLPGGGGQPSPLAGQAPPADGSFMPSGGAQPMQPMM